MGSGTIELAKLSADKACVVIWGIGRIGNGVGSTWELCGHGCHYCCGCCHHPTVIVAVIGVVACINPSGNAALEGVMSGCGGVGAEELVM